MVAVVSAFRHGGMHLGGAIDGAVDGGEFTVGGLAFSDLHVSEVHCHFATGR